MTARDLESSLREGGEKVSEGRIGIDSTRALQRLRDFRFAEPSHWVLEVLRSAALSGAKTVTVRTDADDVEVSFDGKPFPPDSMKHLLEQALNGGQSADEKRTRLLALGVAGALGVGSHFVKVESGNVALTLAGERVELTQTTGKGTHLHLRKAFGWRVTAAFFRGSPEARAITERAYHFPAKLILNGKPLPHRVQVPLTTRSLEGEGWRMEVELPSGAPQQLSELELDVGGVVVTKRIRQLPGLQVHAWVRADGLRRNASGSDVVDDDATLELIHVALRKVSRELLSSMGQELAKEPSWRFAFLRRLLEEKTDDVQPLHKLPLIPGPAGEYYSLGELAEAVRKNSCLHIARQKWTKGSYPTPTVLLTGDLAFAKLLPPGKRVDVQQMVKQKEVVARNRLRHEAQELEPADLPARTWVARARIEATAVTGEVGFEAKGNGAFVRVLHKGRLMESGELMTLSPLRLRAVVDWSRTLADSFFDEGGPTKLTGLVLKYVENAAIRAVSEALPNPEALPHALDLLTYLVVGKDSPAVQLPRALLEAPLFPCLTGPEVSLETLQGERSWRYVNTRFPEGLLDGGRVLLLTASQVALLDTLNSKRMEDVTERLRDEGEVRARLAGPRKVPTVEGVVVKVKVEGEGIHGEVGVPRHAGNRLELTLLKSGLVLETTELSPRYHSAVASVQCDALIPNARWSGASREGAFKLVAAAVNEAQRKLAVALIALPRNQWRRGEELFLIAFLEKELAGFDPSSLDDVTRAVASAPLFLGAHGPRSLLQLKEQVQRVGRFFVLPAPRSPVPEDFEILLELPAMAEAIGEALRMKPEDPAAALSAIEARTRLAALPKAEFKLPPGLSLECEVTEAGCMVLAGLREGDSDQATGHLHLDGRVYCALSAPCALPLAVVIDAPHFEPNALRELTSEQRLQVGKLVTAAMEAVIRQALQRPEDPQSKRALLTAVAHSIDLSLGEKEASALRAQPVFPCTDGNSRSFEELDHDSPQYVIADLQGELPNRRPIVLARDPLVVKAMHRWRRAERVDQALSAQLAALRAREATARVKEVVSQVQSPWRLEVSERDLRGEVVVARGGARRLELFIDSKPLCVVESALPLPLSGAIDSPRLTPRPGFTGVVEDEHYKEAVDALLGAADRLAASLASAPRVPELDETLVRLAFWVASTLSWQWKGKKKPKGKKKKVEPLITEHPLMSAPLLRATDGSTRSVQRLINLHRDEGGVDTSSEGGQFLEPGRTAWWPRTGEAACAQELGLFLKEVTPELQLATSIRQRPRFEEIHSPLAGSWREPVRGLALEGEVAIEELPTGKLVIEVLHQRMLLETWSSDHPVGGVARVDSSALNPNEKWTSARRDAAFKALVASTEGALERLVVRRLALREGSSFRAWAAAAVRWRSGQAGPLAGLVPSLALFSDLKGQPVTIGEVFDLSTRKKKVPVSGALGVGAVEGVLHDSPETRAMLATLGLECDDVTAELSRARSLQGALTARRLASLTWKGEALVKISISTGQLTGELALQRAGDSRGVMLARDGIPIRVLEDTWPGVVGVIDVKDLKVNDDWTAAEPTRAQRSLIKLQVERLYSELATCAPSFDDAERELAAAWMLRFLLEGAVATRGQLDRLTGCAQQLAEAPLFLTVEGEKVNLRAVAGEVSSRERVAVFERRLGVPEGVVSCVLSTSSFAAPWLEAVEEFLGKTKVWRVTGLEAWENTVREADPLEGTPELLGLRFLRREVRLLRSGALGALTPDDLEDVKLSRNGGGTALRYDRKRKLVLLDPEHPDIARSLKEAQQRPERLWVLIAAAYGLVNRELQHVTDAHEAQLLLALAGHLASNPKLLA